MLGIRFRNDWAGGTLWTGVGELDKESCWDWLIREGLFVLGQLGVNSPDGGRHFPSL